MSSDGVMKGGEVVAFVRLDAFHQCEHIVPLEDVGGAIASEARHRIAPLPEQFREIKSILPARADYHGGLHTV